MRWYRVGGDYGPIGGMYHEFFIATNRGWRAARDIFAARIARDYPSHWEQMGLRNVQTTLLTKI